MKYYSYETYIYNVYQSNTSLLLAHIFNLLTTKASVQLSCYSMNVCIPLRKKPQKKKPHKKGEPGTIKKNLESSE